EMDQNLAGQTWNISAEGQAGSSSFAESPNMYHVKVVFFQGLVDVYVNDTLEISGVGYNGEIIQKLQISGGVHTGSTLYFDNIEVLRQTPMNITNPDDASYSFGSVGNVIKWTVTDETTYNATYSIKRNDTTILAGAPWTSQNEISLSLDGLGPGNYNFTIIALDGYGFNILDECWVTITNDPPTILRSGTTTYQVGTTGNQIKWTITDPSNSSPTYEIFHNGTLNSTGSWGTGVVQHDVDGLVVGYHNITIVVDDGSGDTVEDQGWLVVTQESGGTTPGDSSGTNGVWQDLVVGTQTIKCTGSDGDLYAEFLITATKTGQVKITAQSGNPTETAFPGGVRFFEVLVDADGVISFPVSCKFYYDPSSLGNDANESSLDVFQRVNVGSTAEPKYEWQPLHGFVYADDDFISTDISSPYYFAIGPTTSTSSDGNLLSLDIPGYPFPVFIATGLASVVLVVANRLRKRE
ncbi:MAG: hypothetical protein ACTSU5_08440, partial [Promethearchaeota archaeon]